jgi:hypothetical protein
MEDRMPGAPRSALHLAFWVLVAVVLLMPFVNGRYEKSPSINAFRAFYCAGRAIDERRDPYRVEPLRTCEEAVYAKHAAAGAVEPAPLAPFVLAGFAVLAMLPYGIALALFVALLLAAAGLAVWSLHRITGFSWIFLTACLLWTAFARNITFAEVPPLVIGSFCASALLFERGKTRVAAAVAVAALVEPHVALPSLIALALYYPRTRVLLAGFAAVLALVAVAAVGLGTCIEYVAQVLPMHAASEVSANDQYSLTWLLHQLHAGDAVALRLGSVSYAVMSIVGIVVGRSLAMRYGRPALLVLVPAAFAVVGGSFIHDIQLPIALPAAVVLLCVVPDRLKPLLLVSAGVLAISWSYDGRMPFVLQIVILGIIVATAPVDFVTSIPRYRIALAACAAYAMLILVIHALPSGLPPSLPAYPDVSGAPDAIASDVWARYVRSTAYGYASLQTVAAKVPSAAALLLLAVLAAVAARARAAGAVKV